MVLYEDISNITSTLTAVWMKKLGKLGKGRIFTACMHDKFRVVYVGLELVGVLSLQKWILLIL